MNKVLRKFRNKIPFLKLVPDNIYFNLDFSEFFLPNEEVNKIRLDLEQKLGHYVMTYKIDVFKSDVPIEKHLCANLKPAQLDKKQLEILKKVEEKYKKAGVSFCVYAKPLQIIDPKETAGLWSGTKETGVEYERRIRRGWQTRLKRETS